MPRFMGSVKTSNPKYSPWKNQAQQRTFLFRLRLGVAFLILTLTNIQSLSLIKREIVPNIFLILETCWTTSKNFCLLLPKNTDLDEFLEILSFFIRKWKGCFYKRPNIIQECFCRKIFCQRKRKNDCHLFWKIVLQRIFSNFAKFKTV